MWIYMKHARPKDFTGPLYLGGCENSIAGQSPSPGGNLPSDRYLTRCSLLPTACIKLLYLNFIKKQVIFYDSSE